jgi:DNA helicase-2/ATP-dependent DNA helicase PcrA
MLSEVTEDGLTGPGQEAVAHPGSSLLIRGVAGSGKTLIIRERHLRFVAEGAAPERVAVLVPSAAHAASLRQQLQLRITGGYEEIVVLTPEKLAARVLLGAGLSAVADLGAGRSSGGWPGPTVGPGDRLALLSDRIDELSLSHHDVAGRPTALLGAFVRRIDRLKGELIDAGRYRDWVASLDPGVDPDAELEREFAAVYCDHERLLAEIGARDEGGLLLDALAVAERRQGSGAPAFDHVLIDDAHELDRAATSLAMALGSPSLTVAGDPDGAVRRFRGAGAERLDGFASLPGMHVIDLDSSVRCPPLVWRAARAALGRGPEPTPVGHNSEPGEAAPAEPGPPPVELWRCSSQRAEAQAVAVEIERLIAGSRNPPTPPARIAVIVPEVTLEGQAIAVALEERAIVHRVIGEAAFFQRTEIRDVLAWLRLLSDPTDAAAVVRALARPPVELRSVDIARCTQIARRRKLDMVGAMAAALESPQVPPEARDRIRAFLSLYRSSMAAIDSTRPDLYVHRLIERLGLRRHQLFAAQADVAERLRALAAFGELATEHLARSPLATAREFARSVSALAEVGLGRQEEPELSGERVAGEALAGTAAAVQVLAAPQAGGLEADYVFVIGLQARIAARAPEPIPDALLTEPLPADGEQTRRRMLRQEIHLACSRAGVRLVLAYPRADDRGEALVPAPVLEEIRETLALEWQDREEELFGPAEALHSTYRLLRDELLQGTMRAAGRIGEMRLDTDLDISHAVVRYLELLKVAALIAQGESEDAPDRERGTPAIAESLRDINARILQAVSGEQREIYETSALDEYLLDAERGARDRAQAVAARDEPSLEAFLPLRGEGVVLSASDIDTYRTCPLKYKFARVFRIPQEPTVHQRFGILVHQVLERYHSPPGENGGHGGPAPSLPELLGLLDAGWRRGGFGDSLQERQLRGKAASALTRYHERFKTEDGRPVWFERQFTFPIGPHLLRGRVDRVDLLPDGAYELIDYKTGRPKTAAQLADDVQLSLYAVGARESWRLDASRQAYYYLLDDEKVAVPDDGDRGEWVCEVATEVAEGIRAQGFEPTPSYAACSMCDYRLVCPAAER